MLNRNYLWPILIAICFIACKPLKDSDLRIVQDEINPKLPALELRYGDFANAVSYADPCACELNLISDEVVKNLSEHYGDQYGYIVFKIHVMDVGNGLWWLLPSIYSLTTFNLLGMPYAAYMRDIEVEVKILDAERNLLKEYKGRGKARNWVAYYYGYREKYARLKVFPDAFNEAMSQIRTEMQLDITQLRSQLLATGTIK